MSSTFHPHEQIVYADHPRFANVRIAVLVAAKEGQPVGVSRLDIAPGTEIPIHTHDPQVDSIFVVAGCGEAFVNGEWRPIGAGDFVFVPAREKHGIRNTGADRLHLFIHHSPALI
ncbi:MAG: cupin domain-containing protein [Desulfobacteraceae bacterium]|nr:cupin domain-containing protein [Desulfobacteraceae bacterium]